MKQTVLSSSSFMKRPSARLRWWAVGMTIALGGMLLLGVVSGCSETSPQSERPDPVQMVDSGSWYSRNRWPHDGRPVESKSFVVYSDGASPAARQRLADVAEVVLAEIIAEMRIDPEMMFRFPAGQDKIDLYANRYHLPENSISARAYYAGVIIWSFDHEAADSPTELHYIRPILKHELVHVVEALLKGNFVGDIPVGDPRRMPVWFSEGMAEALRDGTDGDEVRSLDKMNHLIGKYGQINPISWRVERPDFEAQAYNYYYYPMSQLAVEYLLDADGLGRSPEDLTGVMLDMGEGKPFSVAFETHMGISESDYETQFFALMADYLPQRDPARLLATVGSGLLSLLAASFMASSLVWGLQHWPATTPATVSIGGLTRSRLSHRGFLAEISAMALVAVGFVSILLFRIAFAGEPSGAEKAQGFATSAGYLVVSAASLIWAIRRWASRSRSAYLIPLLVLVATGLEIITIQLIF